MQVVTGYSAVADIFMAGERGELDGGTCNYSSLAGKVEWMRDRKARILLQFGSERAPYLPDTPTAAELAQTDIGRAALKVYAVKYKAAYPFILPPEVPDGRIAILRAAFLETMKDPQFIAEAGKLGFDVDPISGEAIAELVQQINSSPEEAVAALEKLLA
jgi:tripartite-type tricarboxylate transporter receptor subunit TctC